MAAYSHSKLSTFEQCRYKYKLNYIDKIKVIVPTTIEMFMGDIVHRTLQKLYVDISFQINNSPDSLISYYNSLWEREFTPEILVAKEVPIENYQKMGETYIRNYVQAHAPFDDMTIIGIETQDRLKLPDGNDYHVRIDKLGFVKDTYFVCDYKTNNRMKDQLDADSDRQLAMYSLWVRRHFPDAKRVILLWHMLAFTKDVMSERTEEQLELLQADIMRIIKEIESCEEYPTNVTRLCDYCVFKSICPSFKHEAMLEQEESEEFKKDDGVKLVDQYAHYMQQKEEAETKLEEFKSQLVRFAESQGIDTVYGSNKKVNLRKYVKVILPEDKTALIDKLKEKNLIEEYSMLNYMRLSSAICNGKIDLEIAAFVKKETDWRVSVAKR